MLVVTSSVPGAYGGVPIEEETSLASVAVLATKDERVLGDVTGQGAPVQVLDEHRRAAQLDGRQTLAEPHADLSHGVSRRVKSKNDGEG